MTISRHMRWLLPAISVFFAACGALPPVANPTPTSPIIRVVSSVSDAKKTLTVNDGMVFYDEARAPSHGIRFPPGVYVLEAEDASYWYLRAPSPLELRDFKSGRVISDREVPGGIMIGKSFMKTIGLPAAAYKDDGKESKALIWQLGGEFVGLEGSQWSRTF